MRMQKKPLQIFQGRAQVSSLKMILASVTVLFIAPACAEGVLGLQKGIYVDTSQSCRDPANAGIKHYDGVGLNSAHTHACKLNIQSAQGRNYVVTQRCIDAGVGAGPDVSDTFTLTMINHHRFTFRQGQGAVTYRYCPDNRLPAGLVAK